MMHKDQLVAADPKRALRDFLDTTLKTIARENGGSFARISVADLEKPATRPTP
jgi:hypothetical protein